MSEKEKIRLLEERVRGIEDRNKRVEADKAWEMSKMRRAVIGLTTYLIIALFLLAVGTQQAFLIALIPAAGYILSTMTLPEIKKLWLKYYKK